MNRDDLKMYRVSEAAEALGVKESTIRKWILLRKVGYSKLAGGAVRIPQRELERVISFVPAREVIHA
jgi:excisionase family DNA binding protein